MTIPSHQTDTRGVSDRVTPPAYCRVRERTYDEGVGRAVDTKSRLCPTLTTWSCRAPSTPTDPSRSRARLKDEATRDRTVGHLSEDRDARRVTRSAIGCGRKPSPMPVTGGVVFPPSITRQSNGRDNGV